MHNHGNVNVFAISDRRSGSQFSEHIQTTVLCLHRLAQKLRERRFANGKATRDLGELFEGEEYPEAHTLVEEFMILTNLSVAQFVMKKFEDHIPLRYQSEPSVASLERWIMENPCMHAISFYFQQFQDVITYPDDETSPPQIVPKIIPILQCMLDELHQAYKMDNMDAIRNLLGKEGLHPLHALALSQWFMMQQNAKYICSGDEQYKEKGHFTLNASHYAQFTSPMRRYLDIVVHRLVVAALTPYTQEPYTKDEVKELCQRANKITRRAKKYDVANKVLNLTEELKKSPVFIPGIVSTVDDRGIEFEVSQFLYFTIIY